MPDTVQTAEVTNMFNQLVGLLQSLRAEIDIVNTRLAILEEVHHQQHPRIIN